MLHPDTALLKKVVEQVGTPVMVYDENQIRDKITAYVSNLTSERFETRVLYASKAFLCGYMAELALSLGTGFDAVSGAELDCLAKAGVPAEKIYFHGNNKTYREVTEFFNMGHGHIVMDNPDELELVIKVSEELKKPMDILIRVNPGVEAHTHEYIQTANKDSKFGISIDKKDEIRDMVEKMNKSSYLTFKGFHSHIGSQIFGSTAFEGAVDVMTEFISYTEKSWGITVEELDLGGGFAIRFTDADDPVPVDEICRRIVAAVERNMDKYGLNIKTVCIEPGRSIAGDAGHTIYTAGCRKSTESKEYLFIDGGMADNIRPALYDAQYQCVNLTREGQEADMEYIIAGKCCESGDLIIKNAKLPVSEPGDLILVYSTGAYGYSMASNYNKLGRPPVVFVTEDSAKCVLKREDYAELSALETRNDLF